MNEKVLKLSLAACNAVLLTGGETYRTEETGRRILEAYGMKDIQVFVIANYLSISFVGDDDQDYYGQRRVMARADNLRKLDMVNDYVRKICKKRPDPEKAVDKLEEIINLPVFSTPQQIFITGFVGFGFTFMLGGTIWASLYSFVLDIILRIILIPLIDGKLNRIFVNFVGGMVVTLLAIPCKYFGLQNEMQFIIAGSFMYLFPGIGLTNSIRDIIAADYLAGITRLVETLLTAISIAIGSGVAMSLFAI